MNDITLPATLTTIEEDAFNISKNSPGVIICESTVPPTLDYNPSTGTPFGVEASNIHVYVPAGSLEAYRSSKWGTSFASSAFTARYSDGKGDYYLDETNHTAKLISVSNADDVTQYDVLETIQSEGNEYTVTSINEDCLLTQV